MPVRADSDTLLSLLANREERSLLAAAGTRRTLASGESTDRWISPLCELVFLAAVEREALVHVQKAEVPRAERDLGDLGALGRVEIAWRDEDTHDAVLSLDGGAVALLGCRYGACEIVVAAREAAVLRGAHERLAAALRSDAAPADTLAMRFWSAGAYGGQAVRRAVTAPDWTEIERNYPRDVRAALVQLMAAREPGAGSLLLWHGAPGTGKTHAVQALARAWREWCSVHCVTDPERLLGGTKYLMDVATDPLDDDERDSRLVVLEDAGELMAASARAEIGQGLSRLLNLTDGLLGQGVRCILLVTTNEPIGRLHPAVRRPGRCWASIDFAAFEPAEATAWLALREVEREVTRPATLAELYAIAEDRELPAPAPERFGFARALTR
jgi:hypothetical protein